MGKSNNHQRDKHVGIMPWIVVVAALAVIAAYLGHHYLLKKTPIGDSGDWGAFGDYFTGLLNPLISFFTLILLLRTLQVTRQVRDDTAEMMSDQRAALAEQKENMDAQLAMLSREAVDRDRSTKLATIEGRLNAALQAWRELGDKTQVGVTGTHSPMHLVKMWDTKKEWNSFVKACESKNPDCWKTEGKKALERTGPEIANLIYEFWEYCNEYERAGGERLVTNFYRSRLEPALRRLDEIRYIEPQVIEALRAPKRVFSPSIQTGERMGVDVAAPPKDH